MHVSVIIPTYNCAKWLAESMQSVLAQDHEDIELLIVDDGSTDETADVVAGANDGRVRYFKKSNGGVSSARNVGLVNARGRFVALLDSDDLWPPNYLSTMKRRLTASDCGLAYCTMNQVYMDGRPSRGFREESCVSGQITRELFLRSPVLQATIIRRDLLKDFYFDESLRTAEDTDFFLRVSLRTKFLHVPDIRMSRRVRPNSLSSDAYSTTGACNKILVLDRFYFRLGGVAYLTRSEAMNRISNVCVRLAKKYLLAGARRAARGLCRRAMSYTPGNAMAMMVWLKATPLGRDTQPGWRMPDPLLDHITHP